MRRTTYSLCLGLAILCLVIPISSYAGNTLVLHGTVTGTDGTPINGLQVTATNLTKNLTQLGVTGDSGPGTYGIILIDFFTSVADLNDQISITVEQDGKMVAKRMYIITQTDLGRSRAEINIQLKPPPSLTKINPDKGVLTGGETVQIVGNNFQQDVIVTLGGTQAVNVVFNSSTQLTITTPNGTVGPADVVVTNPDGQSITLQGGFTFIHLAPVITSITPDTDTISGGASVTLNGENFQNGATLTFGSRDATDVVVLSTTEISAKVPQGEAGTVEVTIKNPDGQSITLQEGFTFTYLAPAITSITPDTDTILGGASVTLNGENFQNGVTLTFGSRDATDVVVLSTTEISAKVPQGEAGTVEVTIKNPDGQSATLQEGFTFTHLAPVITSITPDTDTILGGASVTLNGENFQNGATLTFGSRDATDVVVLSTTEISAKVPQGEAGTVKVTIKNPDGQSATLQEGFTFTHLAPVITSITPDTDTILGGASVTLNGENFQNGATLTFGGRDATDVVVLSTTEISAKVPQGEAGTVEVTIKNPDGQSATLQEGFTFTHLAPVITSITPDTDTILGGASVTLNGENFQNGATLTFGGRDATDVVVLSTTEISAKVPQGEAGIAEVTIKNPDGQSITLQEGFTFTHLAPVVTSITPDSGSISGGAPVILNGGNFQPGVTVTFGSRDAIDVVVLSSTEISAKVPSGEAGTVEVTIKNPDGQFVVIPFTYIAFPTWDVNQDGRVNILDLVIVASQFGQNEDGLTGDVNDDKTVNILDLVIVASHFGETTTLAAPSRIVAHRQTTGNMLTRTSLQAPHASLRMRMALTELEHLADTNPDIRFVADLLREWLINTGEIPTKNKLLRNYPNPFNPETWIPYQLAQSTTVSISIYNIIGQRVRQLEVGHRHAGNYINRSEAAYWDGRNDSGERVTSGVYFYVLQAGHFAQTQKMIILK